MRRAILIACALTLIARYASAAEICGDALDNDENGLTDEGCNPGRRSGVCESPLSCSETGWVSWSSGALHYDLPPDVAPRSPYGPSIGFRRFYTSQYAPPASTAIQRSPLGPRWQHNYMSWIDRLPSGDIVIHTPQGEDVFATSNAVQPVACDSDWDCVSPEVCGGGVCVDPENPPQPWHYELFDVQRGSHFEWVKYRLGVYEIRTLDGSTLRYDGVGRLFEVGDAVGNKVTIAWAPTRANGPSAVSTVTDATGVRRLRFGYSGLDLLTTVTLEFFVSGAWIGFHTTGYGYAGSELSTVTIGGELAQRNVYAGGYLARIDDAEGHALVAFRYAAAGQTRLIDTPTGVLGFDFVANQSGCTGAGKTILYFNKANQNACSANSDCGSGALCGGKTGPGTGTCFRAARCLTVETPDDEPLVTEVTALGPSASETCTGACAEATRYLWNVATRDLVGVGDALGSYTTAQYNHRGKPTKLVIGDPDTDPGNGNGARTIQLIYDGSDARLIQVLRPSVLYPGSAQCSPATITACARTEYGYQGNLLLAESEIGWTLNAAGQPFNYVHTTRYTYDAKGRVTMVDGPALNYDSTRFTYKDSLDFHPTERGFLATRVHDATIPTLGEQLVESVYAYDFWGNPIEWFDFNQAQVCRTYDVARNYLEKSSTRTVSFWGWYFPCNTPLPTDLIEEVERDSALRPTKIKNADGSCMHYEYDARGRLARTKRRDDCNAASPGDREEYTYDADGLPTQTTIFDSAGVVKHRTVMSYYDSRRLQSMTNPVDMTTSTILTYDARGALTDVATSTLGRMQFDRDRYTGLVTTAKGFNTPSSSEPWALTYDRIGQFRSLLDPDQKVLISTYDDLGRRVRVESPDKAMMPVRSSYTHHGRLASTTDPTQSQGFTYDLMGRLLTANYQDGCNGEPEIEHVYDQAAECPGGIGCTNLRGRLAYSRVTLVCDSELDDDALDQETFYSYDAAGRIIAEYIRDDWDRVAVQRYTWSKAGHLEQITLPSTATIGWTRGGGASNSDTDRVTAVWRTQASSPIVEDVRWNPYGPLAQYNRRDTISGSRLLTRFSYNLAYRPTSTVLEGQTLGGPYYRLVLAEDGKGRVISRDFWPSDPQLPGVFDSYYRYDGQDRVLCETTTPTASCPSSGANIKNSHPLAFTGAGDRKTLVRPAAGSGGGQTHVFTLASGTHQIASVAQTDGATPHGTTAYTYDAQGRRASDDNPILVDDHLNYNDRRDYEYDGRGNLIGVRGTYPLDGQWHDYYMQSAFDAGNRRVFKAFLDEATQIQQQWFFYYDPFGRLTEVRHIPDASVENRNTFFTYQLIWLEGLLVAYWQTNMPSGSTFKRYVSTDEIGRPVRMHSWPASGDSTVAWATNPDAWGMDTVTIGANVFQPIGFAGQYHDRETASYLPNRVTQYRPGLVHNGFRTYDPYTGSYLQLDPLVEKTWSPYAYANGNPVGNVDPNGLEVIEIFEWWPWPILTEPNWPLIAWMSGPNSGPTGDGRDGGPDHEPPAPPEPGKPEKKPQGSTDPRKCKGFEKELAAFNNTLTESSTGKKVAFGVAVFGLAAAAKSCAAIPTPAAPVAVPTCAASVFFVALAGVYVAGEELGASPLERMFALRELTDAVEAHRKCMFEPPK